MKSYEWYSQLIKPDWAPPGWLFGPVWTVLYIIIAITYGRVFYMAYTRQIPWIVTVPFILNLIFNIAFTPIQFGLQNLTLASIDILLVLVTLVVAMLAIYRFAPIITYANIPYLLWVCFATVLQMTVWWMNR
jgi:tryptophan-rich sensory protein